MGNKGKALRKSRGVDGVVKARKRAVCFDRNMPKLLTIALRAQGWKVRSADDELLCNAPDEDVRRWARDIEHVLFTTDKEFYFNDQMHPLRETGGLVVLSTSPKQSPVLFEMFLGFLKIFPREEWMNAKALVSSTGFRFKRLGRQGENVFKWTQDGPVQIASWS